MSNAKNALEMLNRPVKDILLVEHELNRANIILINYILNFEENNNYNELKIVLNRMTRDLMKIYTDCENNRNDFLKDFPKFQDYYLKEKNLEKRKVLKEQGENYENILKEIEKNFFRPGPNPKSQKK